MEMSEEINGHIFAPKHVCISSTPIARYGYGKRRAWCDSCRRLVDNTQFFLNRMAIHPDNSSALYYEPVSVAKCQSCTQKQAHMGKDEYWERFKAMTDKYMAEGSK